MYFSIENDAISDAPLIPSREANRVDARSEKEYSSNKAVRSIYEKERRTVEATYGTMNCNPTQIGNQYLAGPLYKVGLATGYCTKRQKSIPDHRRHGDTNQD